jgi:hypothetical protein
VLRQTIGAASGPVDKITAIFQSILSRSPSSAELAAAMREIRDVGDEKGYPNIVWALINTREFLFVQ